VYKEFLSLAHLLNKIKIGLQCQFGRMLLFFGDASYFEDKDELNDEDDATEESHDGSNIQNNGTADQQV
ncbi:hypothetical protein Tco_0330398, partial [Tanacetum coccineum]